MASNEDKFCKNTRRIKLPKLVTSQAFPHRTTWINGRLILSKTATTQTANNFATTLVPKGLGVI